MSRIDDLQKSLRLMDKSLTSSSISNITKGFDFGYLDSIGSITQNLNFGYMDSIKNLTQSMVQSLNFGFTDAIKGITQGIAQSLNTDYMSSINNMIQSLNFDYMDSIKNITRGLAFDYTDSIKSMVRSLNFDVSDSIKNIVRSINNGLDAMTRGLNFGIIDSISESLKAFHFEPLQDLYDLANKSVLDDSDYEKAKELSDYALETAFSKNVPVRFRKNIIILFFQKLWRLIGKPQVGVLIAVLIFCCQSFLIKPQVTIRETIREIIIIEKENTDLVLRGIIRDNTRLFCRPSTRSRVDFVLDCGDIVEVLETRKEWIKVRIYQTDVEGWVLKKYTKRAGG